MISSMMLSMIARRPRAPDFRLEGILCNGQEGGVGELQVHALQLKELSVLFDQGVLGLRQDPHQGVQAQVIEAWPGWAACR